MARLRGALVGLILGAWIALPAGEAGGRTTQPADSVVVIVSAERSVTEISRLELADVYLGRTNDLVDGRRVVPVDQEPGSAAREAFYETYLRRSPAEIKSHWAKLIFTGRGRPPRTFPDGPTVKQRVAGDPDLIGYVDAELVDESVRMVTIQ